MDARAIRLDETENYVVRCLMLARKVTTLYIAIAEITYPFCVQACSLYL